jgi:hypothetical protein
MAFTALDVLREGYEVHPVVEAVGGTHPRPTALGLDRTIRVGRQPICWVFQGT